MTFMGVYHQQQWDNFVLPDGIWVWSPKIPAASEERWTWYHMIHKACIHKQSLQYLRAKMTWSNLQNKYADTFTCSPMCRMRFGHLTHTHLPILLAGSLGESCAEFTRGRQSKRLWGNAKTNNIKNLRIATDGSIWFAQMCVCVCLYVCKPVVCSQTRTLAQTLSKQHLCWTPSDDSVKNNHKLSLGNILHLSVWTVSISGTKCTEIDQPTSPDQGICWAFKI